MYVDIGLTCIPNSLYIKGLILAKTVRQYDQGIIWSTTTSGDIILVMNLTGIVRCPCEEMTSIMFIKLQVNHTSLFRLAFLVDMWHRTLNRTHQADVSTAGEALNVVPKGAREGCVWEELWSSLPPQLRSRLFLHPQDSYTTLLTRRKPNTSTFWMWCE